MTHETTPNAVLDALVSEGETDFAEKIREIPNRLSSKEFRSEVFRKTGATMRQKAIVLNCLSKQAAPSTSRSGYGYGYGNESRDTRLAADDFHLFAELEQASPEEQLAYKREHFYRKYVTLDAIPTWTQHAVPQPEDPLLISSTDRWGYRKTERLTPSDLERKAEPSKDLNEKVSLWRGNICELEVDAAVNAANSSLRGGGGIDGAIHGQSGPLLDEECAGLDGCPTGKSVVTLGYRMPAKHIIHTVGPMRESPEDLKSCYVTVLDEAKRNGFRTIAFCCVSTGIYGFPLIHASHIALETTRKWLEEPENAACVDRIIFCVFLEVELQAYERLMVTYFPQN